METKMAECISDGKFVVLYGTCHSTNTDIFCHQDAYQV